MTKSIDTRWFRVLLTAFGLALTMASAAGCGKVTPCTCDCLCTNLANTRSYCKSHDPDAGSGTVACSNACVAITIPGEVNCGDPAKGTPPRPDGGTSPTPTCPAGQTWAQYKYCERCTDTPSLEKDVLGSGCTEADAKAEAQRLADQDSVSNDCSVTLGTCTGQ